MGLIYRILCTATNQSYVGQTVDAKQRWAQHIAELRKGKHHSHKLQEIFWKHGESCLSFEVLEDNVENVDLTSREAYWMKEHKGYGDGLNIQFVGHPNAKPATPVVPRKSPEPPPPPLTMLATTQKAQQNYSRSELHEHIEEVARLIVEVKTSERIALETVERLRQENELLVRENAVLRWRLGERRNDEQAIA